MSIFEIFLYILLITTSIVLYRVIKGPSLFDRIVGINAIGTKTILMIVVISYVFERPSFLDIALLYAILNFIGSIVISIYIERGGVTE
ncbi:cation:proton antiporter [Archaeoglobales archaeon]|nr:MAG: cation:proton antiporter [Archaeoglobales archaeon]